MRSCPKLNLNGNVFFFYTRDKTDKTLAVVAPGAGSTKHCNVCGVVWDPKLIRQHIGAHLLTGNWPLGKDKPRFPCGMCGVGEAIGLDLDSNTVTSDACCYMWVKGKKGHYSCNILGRGDINLTTAAKCSLAHPCTNRPFKCTEEDCDKFVWTYNMSDHYKDMHAGIEM